MRMKRQIVVAVLFNPVMGLVRSGGRVYVNGYTGKVFQVVHQFVPGFQGDVLLGTPLVAYHSASGNPGSTRHQTLDKPVSSSTPWLVSSACGVPEKTTRPASSTTT